MNLCDLCKFENDDDMHACVNCGGPLLRYHSLCGMPMLGGSSSGQVLNMRYIIEEQLSEEESGCTYKAEDAVENTNVLIRALPFSVSLDSRQIELLKEAISEISSLSHLAIDCPKAFNISGKVRYFVYEYRQKQKYVDNEILEKIKKAAADKIASEVSARTKAESELQSYRNKFEILQSEVEERREQYEEILNQTQLKFTEQTQHLKADYEKKIDELNTQIIAEKQRHVEALKHAEDRIEEFSTALAKVDDKIAGLVREKQEVLQQLEENRQSLEKIKTNAEQKQTEYAEQLDKTKWKNKTLSVEIEKLLRKSSVKSDAIAKEKPDSRIKIAAVIFPLTLVVGVILGIAASYLYINSESRHKNQFEQWIASLISSKRGNDQVSVIKTESESPNEIVPVGTDEVAVENILRPKETEPVETSLTQIQEREGKFEYKAPAKETSGKSEQSLLEIAKRLTEVVHGEVEQDQPQMPIEVQSEKEFLTDGQIYLNDALQGDSNAMFTLGSSYLNGDGMEKNIEKAVEWFQKAADKGDDNAMYELGLMYYSGEDIEKDHNKALELFEKSAESGNIMAMYNAGRIYHRGGEVAQDKAKAVQYYERAAKQGIAKSMNQLAQMYFFGDLVEQDYEKSAEYYERSANEGDTNAMYNLAILYHAGVGVDQDIRKAMLWFIKAAREGDSDSMYRLGVMFEGGNGIEANIEKAIHWYQSAAQAGHEAARQQLVKLGQT